LGLKELLHSRSVGSREQTNGEKGRLNSCEDLKIEQNVKINLSVQFMFWLIFVQQLFLRHMIALKITLTKTHF
jgi:hypothetical protein